MTKRVLLFIVVLSGCGTSLPSEQPDLERADMVDGGCFRDCIEAAADCGAITSCSGAILHCGDCRGGQTCGGGGVPNVCGGS